jgi:hypothetical protein
MNKIKLFANQKIRTHWDEAEEEWYFSIVDVVAALTDQETSRSASTYWAVLKKRLIEEGFQLLTNCKQLKMTATDGKERLTDVATAKQLLRIIQSIPSRKAEPFKLWLAEVGNSRLNEAQNPELTIERAILEKKLKSISSICYCNTRCRKTLSFCAKSQNPLFL